MDNVSQINERITRVEERSKSNTKRLDEHDKKLENIHELTVAVKEVALETRETRKDVNDMNTRLKNIEEKPAKNWNNLIEKILAGIAAAVVGYIAAKFGL